MEGFLLKRADRGLVRPYKNRWFVLAGRELRIFVKHTSTDPMAVYDLSEISDPLFVCYMAPPKKTVGGRRASVASSSIPDGFDQCSGRRVSLVGSSAAPIPLPTSAPPPPVRRSEPNTAPQGYYFEIRHPKKTIELLAPTMELRNAWTAVFRAAISGHPISKTEFEKHLSNQDAVLNAEHSRSQLSISASSSRRHSISSPSDSPHHHQMIRKYQGVRLALTDSDDGTPKTIEMAVAFADLSPSVSTSSSKPGRRKVRASKVKCDGKTMPPKQSVEDLPPASFTCVSPRLRQSEAVDLIPSAFKVSSSPSFSGSTSAPNTECQLLASGAYAPPVPPISSIYDSSVRRR